MLTLTNNGRRTTVRNDSADTCELPMHLLFTEPLSLIQLSPLDYNMFAILATETTLVVKFEVADRRNPVRTH